MVEIFFGSCTGDLYKSIIDTASHLLPACISSPKVRLIASSDFDRTLCGSAARIRGLPYEFFAKREAKPPTAAVEPGETL